MCNNVKLENIFHKYKNNDFLIKEDGSVTSYFEFWIVAKEIAMILLSIGLKEGDFLLLKIENSGDYLKLYIACMLTGIIACPIDPDLPKERYETILNEIKPRYIIDNIQKINDIEINDTIENPSVNNENNKNCIMLFSSGTTGKPKGIVHSVMSLLTSAKSFAQLSGINTKTIVYHHFPMFYMAGIFNMFLCPMVSGGKVVLGKRFSAEQMFSFWNIPMKYGVNNLTLTPTMAISLARIYRHDEKVMTYIQSLDSIISTGSYLYETVFSEFLSKFSIPLQSCYGVTEVGGTITYKNKKESVIKYQDSVGYFDKDIKFICNGTKRQPDEIRVKTPFMMSGYFINNKIISGLKNGFFYTGDIGYIENARLFVTGRKGERVKKGGEFVSLSYIEDILMKFELIDELSVVSIEDSFWGNKILVFYTFGNHVVGNEINEKIDNYALQHLTSIEMPDEYICIDKIPKTSIGKVKKKDLINIYNKKMGN